MIDATANGVQQIVTKARPIRRVGTAIRCQARNLARRRALERDERPIGEHSMRRGEGRVSMRRVSETITGPAKYDVDKEVGRRRFVGVSFAFRKRVFKQWPRRGARGRSEISASLAALKENVVAAGEPVRRSSRAVREVQKYCFGHVITARLVS